MMRKSPLLLKSKHIKTLIIGLIFSFVITFTLTLLKLQRDHHHHHHHVIPTVTNFSISSFSPYSEATLNNETTHNKHDGKTTTTAGKGEDAVLEEFHRHDGVVIVTKVHGKHQLPLLKQSMCLLHFAYNNKVNYDIVLFTTLPIMEKNETLLADIRSIIHPAILTVVVDNDGIVNEINKLSPIRRSKFLKRCNVSLPEEVTWDSECYEDEEAVKTSSSSSSSNVLGRISYNWQAEFRSWHIWRHRALQKYNYMMWIDTDAFATTVWDRDPIAIAMKNRLVIYFDNYPQGRAKEAQSKVKQVFGNFVCSVRKLANGKGVVTSLGDSCEGSQLWTIHGMFHITDLNFFRQNQVQHWAETMIGDCFLCRKFDDQLAVTVPSVILAPERSWDMYKSGVKLKVFHNNLIDGKRGKKAGGFINYWNEKAKSQFPEAWNKCEITEGS